MGGLTEDVGGEPLLSVWVLRGSSARRVGASSSTRRRGQAGQAPAVDGWLVAIVRQGKSARPRPALE